MSVQKLNKFTPNILISIKIKDLLLLIIQMKKQIIATGFLLFSLMLPSGATASNLTGLYVFGDSLVDTGNLFNVTLNNPNVPNGPIPPYRDQDGNFTRRFSNGPIWVDKLADKLNLNPTLFTALLANPTLPTREGINFAFGGATTGIGNIGDPTGQFLPGLQSQIARFSNLLGSNPSADQDALYILLAGGNDYNQAISNPNSSPPIADLPAQVTANLSTGVQSLFNLGARNFLVVNLPNLEATPSANSLDQANPGLGISLQLNALTAAHNFLLDQQLNALKGLPEIKITTLDVNSLLSEVADNPNKFGLTNVTDSCLINFQSGFIFDGVCDDPDKFLFWDDIHPTTKANQLIGKLAIKAVHIPESASTLGILAFGVFCASAIPKRRIKGNTR